VVAILAVGDAGAQFQNRVTLRGRGHDVAVPAGWSIQTGKDSVTFVPPRGRTAGVSLYAVARAGQNDAFGVADHYVNDFTAKLPHLTVAETRPTRLAGSNGAIKVLTGSGKVPEEMWVAVSLGPDTIYVFTAYATVTEIAILEKDLRRIVEGIAPVAAAPAPREPAATPAPRKPDETLARFDKLPPLPQPSSARPLVDDPLIGLVVDAVPDWGVAVDDGAYLVDKRLGQGKRLLVGFMLGAQAFNGDGAAFARAVAPDTRYTWERWAGRTALAREAPDGAVRELFLLRRGLPLRVIFVVRGTAWSDPAAEAARKQLEKVLRVLDPVRPDPSAKKLRVVVGGVAAVEVPRGWTFRSYGPGASAIFDGPAGAQARVRVATKLQMGTPKPGEPLFEWPQPTCDVDGTRPPLQPTKVAGREARQAECPRDVDAQLAYTIDAGAHWVTLGLASPTGAHAPSLAAFPRSVKLL
jgi:hypothetical protein